MGIELQDNHTLVSISGENIRKLQSTVRGHVDEIFAYTHENNQHEFYIKNMPLAELITEYPYLWGAIQYKIKEFILKKIADPDIIAQNELELRDSIIKILMKPSIHNPITKQKPENIKLLIDEEFIKNTELFEYIEQNTVSSFIEYSNAKLNNLQGNQIKGLIKRITGRTTKKGSNEIGHLNEIFKDIIKYTENIYHINLSSTLTFLDGIGTFGNFDFLAELLKKEMDKGGIHRRDALLLIKAIYAWGHLPRIKQAQNEAIVAQENFYNHLNGTKGSCKDTSREKKGEDAKTLLEKKSFVYAFEFSNGTKKDIHIETRVKSIESILIKLFADENYSDVDSVSDLLGIRMYLGELSQVEKNEVIGFFGTFIGKNSGIFKNKNYLSEDDIDGLQSTWNTYDCTPIGIESKRKGRTSSEYKDCKYSGYMAKTIHDKQVGTEIQFFDTINDPDPVGVANHSILDTKKIIQGWYRSAHIITGQQIAEVILRRCFDEQEKSISGLSFNEIFLEIYKQILVPYGISGNHSNIETSFAVKGYEHLIEMEYPEMQKLEPKSHIKILEYINGLQEEYLKNQKHNM
ncbi:hypothetical protein K2X92_04875 [Candidatus Gracilibacteria bacterium]|nr:hypothetical protein [Candidatus Gracilibacteria bacterium]